MDNNTSINNYADMMTLKLWLRIGREAEVCGMSFRGLGAAAGVDHSLISEHVRIARSGRVPMDTRLEIIDRICSALERPLSYFLTD